METGYLYILINSRKSWDHISSILQYDSALDEIFFWKQTVDSITIKVLSIAVYLKLSVLVTQVVLLQAHIQSILRTIFVKRPGQRKEHKKFYIQGN